MPIRGEAYRSCPECAKECVSVDTDWDNHGDPDYSAVEYYFECEHCGCEFNVIIRTTEETEVTIHGKESQEED